MSNKIIVKGAREHNLKNIDVEIPRDKLTVITGLSGSGKSSLAFDTIYAEGQRRYIDTFSIYAKSFLGSLEKPDFDEMHGLSPVISIEQKTTNKNPRSTVGTVTEIYDFIRLLYARAGEARSYKTGLPMIKYTEAQILQLILDKFEAQKIMVLAPVVRNRKGHYRDLFENIMSNGFIYCRVDGELVEIDHGYAVDRYKNHTIEIVIDRLIVSEKHIDRLRKAVSMSIRYGKGSLAIYDVDREEVKHLSKIFVCPTSGISYSEPAPHNFSFNSPQGACGKCRGFGYEHKISLDLIVPDQSKSIGKGAIEPLGGKKNSLVFWTIETILNKHGFKIDTPFSELSEECKSELFFGTDGDIRLTTTPVGHSSDFIVSNDGVIDYLLDLHCNGADKATMKWKETYMIKGKCSSCNGERLRIESRNFFIGDKNIAALSNLSIDKLFLFFNNIEDKLTPKQLAIASEIVKEIITRLGFLKDVGVGYLSLNRGSATLSGGESQRIRLATQIGSKLVNVLYVLDEPSIGLHQIDNQKLINSLNLLRDSGNSIIVVEHDKDMMLSADYLIDIGPGAGRLGGEVVASGTPKEVCDMGGLTADYLTGRVKIEIPEARREGSGLELNLLGATGNNLKDVDLTIPLGKFIAVTGVSGSGKSSIINRTLSPILMRHFYRSTEIPLPYRELKGVENIDKIIRVDQSPLGRTPRSNPATYTSLFSDIRNIFAQLPEARIRGYKPSRFSFNVKGGRCETCKGGGVKTLEMNFLPDVYVECDECRGYRYNRETLDVRYKGKSISDVLSMTINKAVEFFESIPSLRRKLETLQDVGLGYITLGQSSTTLSGGEAQRVKLATELSKRDTGKTLYILDEPTTGLHFEDIKVLISVLDKLVDKGNSVIVIEHNMDIIKVADYVIDIGPKGGDAGGSVIAEGTPEQVAECSDSFTGQFLKDELK